MNKVVQIVFYVHYNVVMLSSLQTPSACKFRTSETRCALFQLVWSQIGQVSFVSLIKVSGCTEGEMTSQNLWPRHVRHFVGITWQNVLS